MRTHCCCIFGGCDGEGVKHVTADSNANKVTVVGKVDPSKLREKMAEKLKKKVDLISPQPSKKQDANNDNDNKKKADDKNNANKPDEKKPKDKEVNSLSPLLCF